MPFHSFRDINAWKRARRLTAEVYRVTEEGLLSRDFGLRDQLRRSAVSIMSNIAEGVGRKGNQEFIQFLSVAQGSTSELQSQLFVALDVGYLDDATFAALYGDSEDVMNLIGGLIRYLKSSSYRGSKFK
jgi:four helix bundle protein